MLVATPPSETFVHRDAVHAHIRRATFEGSPAGSSSYELRV
jgi:hypothetical protein